MGDPIKLRAVFMGTSSFAAEILSSLLENKYNIISVYTQPGKKVGRDGGIGKSAVAEIAEKNDLKVFEPQNFSEETINELKDQKPDMIIVAAYGKILPQEVLEVPGFGSINVHASMLPKFRGPSPIQNAILEGEAETGTTIMLMDQGIDTGDILKQKKIAIDPDETYPELLSKIAGVSSSLLLETLPFWAERKIKPQKQNENQATYCQLIEREDGKIIWTDDTVSIYNRYRAFIPWPGIFAYWKKNGFNLRLKLSKISPIKNDFSDKKSGEIFDLDGKAAVKTADGAIILEEVQLEGKAKTKISDFINGYPDFIGSILE